MNRHALALALLGFALALPPLAHAQDAANPPAAETPETRQQSSDEGAEAPDTGELAPVPELTAETARRAFDAYSEVQQKFADAAFEEYDSIEDFVKRAPQGKDFEAVIRAHGFDSVTAWIPILNALEFTIGALNDNQEGDLRQQIDEVKADASLSADDKTRIVQSLEAAIPSENNRKVVQEMMADPAYAEKLKAFTSEE